MILKIIEKHSERSVDVLGIVQRIVRHLPAETIDGLQEIAVLGEEQRGTFG